MMHKWLPLFLSSKLTLKYMYWCDQDFLGKRVKSLAFIQWEVFLKWISLCSKVCFEARHWAMWWKDSEVVLQCQEKKMWGIPVWRMQRKFEQIYHSRYLCKNLPAKRCLLFLFRFFHWRLLVLRLFLWWNVCLNCVWGHVPSDICTCQTNFLVLCRDIWLQTANSWRFVPNFGEHKFEILRNLEELIKTLFL